MKKLIFLVLLLFVSGCGVLTKVSDFSSETWWRGTEGGKTAAKYLGISTSLGDRGIGVEFVEDLSGGLQLGEEAELTIRLVNHMENEVVATSGSLFMIWDNFPRDKSGIQDGELTLSGLDGAPGAYIKEGGLRELFKPVEERVKLNYGRDIEFTQVDIISKLSYSYRYTFSKQLCILGVRPEPKGLCNPTEGLMDLGWDSRYSPVAITSIIKRITFVSGKPKVNLKIFLQDFGDGEKSYLVGNKIKNFKVYASGRGVREDSFRCAISGGEVSFKDVVKKEVSCYKIFEDVEENVATTPFNLHIDFEFDYEQLEPLNYQGNPYSIPLEKIEDY